MLKTNYIEMKLIVLIKFNQPMTQSYQTIPPDLSWILLYLISKHCGQTGMWLIKSKLERARNKMTC